MASKVGVAKAAAFVNVGMIEWERRRSEWLSAKKPKTATTRPVDVDELIDKIYENTVSVPFSPVPLPAMVDIVVDIWECQGETNA